MLYFNVSLITRVSVFRFEPIERACRNLKGKLLYIIKTLLKDALMPIAKILKFTGPKSNNSKHLYSFQNACTNKCALK